MELTYQVPRDAYVNLLESMIRKNDRRPLKMLTALLLTVGQMTAVILLCIFKLEGSQRIFVLIWSVLVAGITVLRRCTARQRAKGTLTRLEYSGQLPEDYWKKHRLTVAERELRLSYGEARLCCPLNAVGPVEQRGDALYLYCGGTIFDIVPKSAFKSEGDMAAFAASLREKAARAEAPTTLGKAQKRTGGFAWRMEERDFEEGQYLAYRTLYYRYRFLRKATFIRLAVSVAAMINLMSNRTPVNISVSVLILLLANLENISMIPFVCRLRIRREVGNWKDSHEFNLVPAEETLIFSSEHASVEIPIHKINLCEKIGPYSVIAWNNFPAVVLPQTVADASPELTALLTRLRPETEKR